MFLIMHNPLWPVIIAACTVVASLIAGSTDARSIGPAWPVRALKRYAAPALVVALLGCMYTLATYSPGAEGYYSCRDQGCRYAAAAAANRTMYLRFGLTLLAAFGAIALMMWLPGAAKAGLAVVPWRDKSVSFTVSSGSNYINPDPKKWYFEEESGEFFPIVFRDGDEFLFSRVTYKQRSLKEMQGRRELFLLRRFFVGSLIVFIVSLWLAFNAGSMWIFAVGFAGICGLTVVMLGIGVAFMSSITLPRLKKEMGPAPVPPPGREMVAKQNLHGNAVPLSGERLKRAARGKVNIPPRRDTDRPARDYSV